MKRNCPCLRSRSARSAVPRLRRFRIRTSLTTWRCPSKASRTFCASWPSAVAKAIRSVRSGGDSSLQPLTEIAIINMAKKAKAKPQPVIYPDSVRPPPVLPDARSVADMGFSLTEDELMTVRTAMAIHASSRQPKLLWTGWRQIALALYIGSQHAKKASGGNTATPLYIRANSEFLKKSGLAFINHNDRAAAVRLLPYWDEIDEWRSSLTPNERQRLNNPREVWE